MKLLILGGSNAQLNAVTRAKLKGHTVIVSDYYKDAPAKGICDIGELVSTFDIKANMEVAEKHRIDGVFTLGTDQPVYTAARVAERLGLPCFIDAVTAKAVTNKKVMKDIFKRNNIPTADFRILSKGFKEEELDGISFPVVVKPLDSQGQRGVYKLDSPEEIRAVFDELLGFSREQEILLEEYYPSEEITISGWVHKDKVHILTVTDRVCFHNYPHIGVCIAHDFPTKFMGHYYNEIKQLTLKITGAFNIHNGPIYYQMLIGEQGIKVNEIACRIGGAYEDIFIPAVTGIDVLDMLIEGSLGSEIDSSLLESYDLEGNSRKLSVQMIFAANGKVSFLNDMEKLKKLPGVLQAKYNIGLGSVIGEIENATARAGYMIITGDTEEALRNNIQRAYEELKILDEQGNNLVMNFFAERNNRDEN
ncbi:MAG: carboxylate--amine ligase [Clostridia bacterium]|jgi:biotin carboxylase|nr:carboxylate--amine ligase [Clostridia bacterium]